MSRMKLETQPATRCHQLQLARASCSYLNCLRSDGNGSKGNVGLLNEQNENRNIASQQLATRCHQLQLILARYSYLSCFKSNQNGSKGIVGPLNEQNDNKDIAIHLLNHLVPLAVSSYSSYSFLRLSSQIVLVINGMLVSSMNNMELHMNIARHYLANTQPLGVAGCCWLQLSQLFRGQIAMVQNGKLVYLYMKIWALLSTS